MLISKRRLIHAISYEVILLVIIAIALSFIFSMPLEVTGILGVGVGSRPIRSNKLRFRSISKLAIDILTAEGTLPSFRAAAENEPVSITV